MAITIADERLWSYVVSRSTPYMISDLGYGTYFFFGSLMVLMGFWAMWCIRETKVSYRCLLRCLLRARRRTAMFWWGC